MKVRHAADILNTSRQHEQEKILLMHVGKQLEILRVKEYLFIIGIITAGAFGRVAMQWLPSIEPLTFFAILAGWLFGSRKGFLTGAASLYASNFFVFGGQGPWTAFQMLGFGMAGFMGGLLRKNAGKLEGFTVTITATLLYEITVNIGTVMFMPISIFLVFLTAFPFLVIHVLSNSFFSLFLPKLRQYAAQKGHFDEKELYLKLKQEIEEKFKKVGNQENVK